MYRKTFYGRNKFHKIISYSVCHYHPSLIFAAKAGAYPSGINYGRKKFSSTGPWARFHVDVFRWKIQKYGDGIFWEICFREIFQLKPLTLIL
jgi:hypothetical protein